MNINITETENGVVNIAISPSQEAPAWAVKLQETMQSLINVTNVEKDNSMALSKSVQDLVDQVSASKSL